MTDKIVILDPMTPERLARFRTYVPDAFDLETADGRDEDAQIAAITRADYAITGDVPVSEAMMRAGAEARLKAVHKWGVGYDNIAVGTAQQLGIRVLRTTGSNSLAVAETTLALMLALQRCVIPGHAGVLDGKWLKGELGPQIVTLSGKTVGLIGLGYIGKAVVRLLTEFDCRILYTKPTPLGPDEESELGVTCSDLPSLLAAADIVSLHCMLTPKTAGLIDRAALDSMKDGAVLINTARGGIVVEDDLADALECGKLRGAALDVFAKEPIAANHRLIGAPGVIHTPHIASQSADNYARTVSRMVQNIQQLANGGDVPEADIIA